MMDRNFNPILKFYKFLIILLMLRLIERTQVVSAHNTFLGVESRGIILVWLELIIISSFIVTWIINLRIILHYGSSIIGRPFIYILVGMTFLALARLYIILYNFLIYDLEETTLQFGWHIIFYTGMVSFLLSINNLDRRRLDNKLHGFKRSDFVLIMVLIIINALTFVLTIVKNEWFASKFEDSIFDSSGSVHFIAFLLSGYLALKLLNIKATSSDNDLGKLMVSFIPSFLLFLSLMSLNHFWELITESWGLLDLNNNVVETVEQIFWFPGYFITAYGLNRVYNISKKTLIYQEDERSIKISEGNTGLIFDLLQILSHHIGSSAVSIANLSCNDIGIQFNEIRIENISNLSAAVQNNTKELIGEFPSKFLEEAIKLISTAYDSDN